MTATTVQVSMKRIAPIGGVNNDGAKLGYVTSGTKGTQNDIWKVSAAKTVLQAWVNLDATGASEIHTISGNEITLKSATGSACSGLILYI